MIRYFWKGFQSSIRAQLDVQNRDLDFWDEIVNKIVDVEAKASL